MLELTSMREYFREALEDSLKRQRVGLSDHAKAYIVHLMSDFGRSERVYAGAGHGEKPVMALLMSRAQDCDSEEAVRIYKQIGDASLYQTGFFAESMEREAVGVDYYVSIGGTAYSSVASLSRRDRTASTLFEELADRFADLVDLLSAISLHGERTAKEQLSDERLLSLIERYRKTGNREVLEALAAQGVVIRPGVFNADEDIVH